MNEGKPTKTEFCRSLGWEIDIHWSGLVGLHRLGDKRVAKLMLATDGYVGHYPGIRVTVLNKEEGPVDKTYFKFDDHLDRGMDGRADNRADFPLGGNVTYEVIERQGWHFYIAIPSEPRPFCEAIEAHLGFFR